MRIDVLFLQALRDAAGTESLALEIGDGSTVADALRLLAEGRPKLNAFERSILCAIDEEWVPRSAPLADGDTLALMPPVSGG